MAETSASTVGPSPCGLVPLSGPSRLTDAQWKVLLSIMDTAIPSAQTEKRGSKNAIRLSKTEYDETLGHLRESTALGLDDTTLLDEYLAERPSEIPLFQELLKRMMSDFPADQVAALGTVLSLLNNRFASLPLTGHATAFPQLSIDDRTKVLQAWKTSSFLTLRLLHKQFTAIAKSLYVRSSSNFATLSGFPAAPSDWTPTQLYAYDFTQAPRSDSVVQLQTDVVVVGSGCGAGVMARKIATSGHQVLVVEKGYHFPASTLPLRQAEGFGHLFEAGGMVPTEDGSVVVLAGSCFGGGGTVNWSASLQTQNTVRDEWANKKGLKFFNTAKYQACLDRVCDQMGVSDKYIRPNHGNAALLSGARKLGYTAKPVPQNTKGCEHHDGHCSLGCWKGEKQGPINGWFPDAAKCGAKFMEGFKVEKVVFGEGTGQKVVQGVLGTWTPRNSDGSVPDVKDPSRSQKVFIKAKKVVISAGSLWSPVILKNSGLKNKQIGRNLRLHPTLCVTGIFEKETRPWEGGILTSVVTSLDDIDGQGHGVKLERACMLPGLGSIWCNWTSGFDTKVFLSKYRHMETLIAITRDRDSGYVYPDAASGVPRISYTPSNYDRRHNLAGVIALAKILHIEGALEIHPAIPGLAPFVRTKEAVASAASDSGITDEAFQVWLKELEARGNNAPETAYASAHQMSSCRMGLSERDSVVDHKGKVWGCEGLYVADASVLPSASGVNPMVTIMAISDWISTGLVQELASEKVETARI